MSFWNSLAFSMTQKMLAIWSPIHLPFLNPAWTSGSSWVGGKKSVLNTFHYPSLSTSFINFNAYEAYFEFYLLSNHCLFAFFLIGKAHLPDSQTTCYHYRIWEACDQGLRRYSLKIWYTILKVSIKITLLFKQRRRWCLFSLDLNLGI